MDKIIKNEDSEKTIELSKFFSRKNEEQGIWHEVQVQVQGETIGTGIEIKVLGPNSKAAAVADEEFEKESKEIQKISDPAKRSEMYERAFARKFAALTLDIRSKSGVPVMMDGKEISTKEDFEKLYYESPSFIVDIGTFARKQNNFLVL